MNHAPNVHEFSQPNSRDRVLSLKEEALYSGKGSANLRGATILAVDTGMRPNSELFPLKWADVDLMARPEGLHGVIHIRQGKTVNAQRSLPLTPRAAEVLQRRKREAEAKDKPSAFVFPGAGNAGHIISLQHPHEDAIARHDRENPQDPPPPRHPVRPAALFFTCAHSRLYRPSVTQFSSKAPPHNSRLARQFQKLENTIHTYVQEANLVA